MFHTGTRMQLMSTDKGKTGMQEDNTPSFKGWEYAKIGDYHRNLDPNWSYTPTYLRKMAFVRQKIRAKGKGARILDPSAANCTANPVLFVSNESSVYRSVNRG